MRRTIQIPAIAIGAVAALVIALVPASKSAVPANNLSAGKVELMSAGPLAFGPDGILFVGDSIGGRVVAIDTQDTKAASKAAINVEGIDVQIAGLVGVTPDQVVINAVKVNPISKNVYVSASRGRGPDAAAIIARVDTTGKVSLLPLDNAHRDSVSLVDAPAADPAARANPRMQTITDMNFVNGNLMVAGLSNEEWNSALRSIPFPFRKADQGATLQIWHSSHGRYETQSPIRTFVPLHDRVGSDRHSPLTPVSALVKIPVSELKPGAQVKGAEIADLGS